MEELRLPRCGGYGAEAEDFTPSEVMVRFWRYKRVGDRRDIDESLLVRAAASDEDGFKGWKLSMRPMTQEIDGPEPKRKPKGNRRVVGPVSLEEL